MLGRRTILVLSVLISLALHGLVYWIAPQISLGRAMEAPVPKQIKQYRFHLREEAPPAPKEAVAAAEKKAGGGAKALSSRPGSVQDLLKRDDESLKPDLKAEAFAPIGDVAERAGAEHREAKADLQPSPDALHRADAKIVEIAREDARMGLDVARRVVRPSPERFFSPDEYPALRSTLSDAPEPLVRFDSAGEGLLAKSLTGNIGAEGLATGAAQGVEAASAGGGSGDAELAPETLPLPTEIARAPVEAEKTAAAKETPFEFLDDLVDISLQTYRAQGEDAGFFRVQVKLKEGAKPAYAPKDVVFLIDASSSMQQRKLEAAVAGVRECLANLRKEDRFNLLLFRDTVTAFQGGPVAATPENVEAGRAFLKKVASKGETDVYKALSNAIASEAMLGRASQLVVISDGRATTGIRDARQIINNVSASNAAHHAVYAYAGGNAIDRFLLELLAYRNRGAAAFADKIEDMKAGVGKFYAAYGDPVLVNVEADYSGLDVKTILPAELPDLSAAQPYEIYGRFVPARDKEFAMRLSGRSGAKAKDLVFKLRFDEAGKGGAEIAAGWAFQKSYALIAEIAKRGDAPELLSELRGLGKKYNIRTVYSE